MMARHGETEVTQSVKYHPQVREKRKKKKEKNQKECVLHLSLQKTNHSARYIFLLPENQ